MRCCHAQNTVSLLAKWDEAGGASQAFGSMVFLAAVMVGLCVAAVWLQLATESWIWRDYKQSGRAARLRDL